MKLLIKTGGTLLDDVAKRTALAGQLARLQRHHELVIVHGGGKQMTRYLEAQGIKSEFVNGLRVSDSAVIDALTKVVAGTVNKQFVAALVAEGANAVGLSGLDGQLTSAQAMHSAMGFVGVPVRSDAKLLHLLVANGYTPVIACLAADAAGTIYNVNADQMAASCAVAYGAEKLFFLTDVPGVKGSDDKVMARLDTSELADLVTSGVAYGGMQAKLEAARQALESGVAEIVIAPGGQPDICRRILAGEQAGTRLSAATAAGTL